MAIVYIPQEPMKRDQKTGQWTQAFDLTPAKKYGELKTLLSHGALPIDTEPMVNNLKQSLENFTDSDYLLAIGNPTAMVAAGIIAASNNDNKINMLYWDSKSKEYINVPIKL